MFLTTLLLFQQATDTSTGIGAFLPMILILVVVYFLMMRPQIKKQKEKQQMINELKKGDNVVTRGGLHGKVVGFADENNTVIVKVDDNVKLNMDKNAVEFVKPVGKPAEGKKEEKK